jgi:Uma2 family endonuclease
VLAVTIACSNEYNEINLATITNHMLSTTAKRFTIEEYHRLAELGFLNEDDRVELIRGEIMQMAVKGTRHTAVPAVFL